MINVYFHLLEYQITTNYLVIIYSLFKNRTFQIVQNTVLRELCILKALFLLHKVKVNLSISSLINLGEFTHKI